MKVLWIASCCFALLMACSSAPKPGAINEIDESQYWALLKNETQRTTQYDGFYQTFQASVTRLTSDVVTAGLNRKSQSQLWDAPRLQRERDRQFQELAQSTRFFMRVYTPEQQLNDLHQPNSPWKVYLEFEGKRFDGKVKKLADKIVELKGLYPEVDRFSNYYEVSFNLPTSASLTSSIRFILTGPVGSVEFTYPRP